MASLRPSRHTCIRAAFSAAGFRKWQRHARHRLQVPSCSARGSVLGGCHLCKFWIPSSLSKTGSIQIPVLFDKKTKATFLSSKGLWEGDGLGSSVSSVNLTASACVQGSVEKERAETSTSLWLWAQNQCAVRLTVPRKGSLTSAGPWEDFCSGFPPFAKASVCPVVWEASTPSAPCVQLPWQNWHQALLHRSAPEGTSWTLRKASGER